jgi:hypothetical protein
MTKPEKLTLFGTMQTVLRGECSAETVRSFSTERLAFGIGCAYLDGLEELGESVIVNHQGYVSWNENGQVKTASGSSLHTPVLMGLETVYSSDVELLSISEPIALADLYEQLGKRFPTGVAVIGSVRMATLQSTYIQKPPIFCEDLTSSSP